MTYSFIKVTIMGCNKVIGHSEITQKVFIDEKEKRKNKNAQYAMKRRMQNMFEL